MADDKNKHGLSRYIPESVRREIRQRCGFGCVICGLGFYDYEHFDPDFAEATEHNPNGMTLLCSQCNQKRARGRLSAHTVAVANADPQCRKQGFASEMFDFHSEPIEVFFAGVSFYNCQHLLVVNDRAILSVQPPSVPGSPVRLSGIFCDAIGRESLKIKENEWFIDSDYWDVECIGSRITIRSALGEIVLILRMQAPNGLVVERINMLFEGVRFRGDEHALQFCLDGKNWREWVGVKVAHCPVGIAIETLIKAANDSLF